MIDFSTLNDNQRNAVNWKEGPLLVLAGPGSGKTRVLTYRIASLIETTPEKHFKILGLTFTNKAAAEMRERVADLVPNAGDRTLLTTFHSFAADLLRQHGHHVGLKPDFTILVQDADRYSLLDEAIDRAQNGMGRHGMTSEKLLPLVSRLIENNIEVGNALEVLRRGSFDDPEALASVYKNYRALMIERNVLDFPGLIDEALGMLEKRAGVRKQIQRVYRYICVDEFQDTNLLQYRILRHLVNPSTRNLFVVADDDQIIYQWNGASPQRLWELREDFDMELLQLPENYRCPAAVVKLANRLIEHNFGRPPEKIKLTAYKKASDETVVRVKRFDDFEQEANWVAEDIRGYPEKTRAKCVILARTKKLLGQTVNTLEESGIPAYLAARKNEFESVPLKWLHSTLRLANSRSSREHLSLMCKAFFSLEGISLDTQNIISHAATEDANYLRSFAQAALNREELSLGARNLIKKSLPRLYERMDFWSFEKDAFEWLDTLPAVVPEEEGVFDEYGEEKATWHDLASEIISQHGGKRKVTLHLLLQELDLRSKTPLPPKNAVPCFTIHASKGMEFNHVYLIGMVEDQLPSWAAIKKGDNSREMQEERRNCFVAITRAQQTLSLSYSSSIDGWKKKPSRFLREMGILKSRIQASV
ncbi:MAG: ATP-dependent helicase [Candidatus Dadabacteria bacterium]|nr:ATP-dependent helicase [Candidatus Dadabacteria bacterium]